MSSYGTGFGRVTGYGYDDGFLDYLKAGRYTDAARSLYYTAAPTGVLSSLVADTRAWDTQRVVRTYGDFLQLARWAFNDVGARNSAMKAAYSAYAAAPDRIRDGKGSPLFTSSTPIPTLFARLRDLVSVSPKTKQLVVAKAAEYYESVEQAGASSAPAAAPVFQPSAPPTTAVPAVDVPASADASVPIYQKPWFAPVAALTVVAVAAAVLVPRRS